MSCLCGSESCFCGIPCTCLGKSCQCVTCAQTSIPCCFMCHKSFIPEDPSALAPRNSDTCSCFVVASDESLKSSQLNGFKNGAAEANGHSIFRHSAAASASVANTSATRPASAATAASRHTEESAAFRFSPTTPAFRPAQEMLSTNAQSDLCISGMGAAYSAGEESEHVFSAESLTAQDPTPDVRTSRHCYKFKFTLQKQNNTPKEWNGYGQVYTDEELFPEQPVVSVPLNPAARTFHMQPPDVQLTNCFEVQRTQDPVQEQPRMPSPIYPVTVTSPSGFTEYYPSPRRYITELSVSTPNPDPLEVARFPVPLSSSTPR